MYNLKNSVQLIGYIGNDAEVKVLESGKTIAKTSIATNDTYKNSKGEKVIETQWHKIIGWGKTAELMEKFLKKGSEAVIQGKLTHRTYEDKEGNTRYFSEIIVSEFIKLNKASVTT